MPWTMCVIINNSPNHEEEAAKTVLGWTGSSSTVKDNQWILVRDNAGPKNNPSKEGKCIIKNQFLKINFAESLLFSSKMLWF